MRQPTQQLHLDDLADDPHPALAWLRERAPVCWVPALDGWLVTSRDAVVQVLDDPVRFTVDDPRFSTATVVGPSMLSLDGAEHSRHRRPFAAGFRQSLVDSRYTGPVRELAADLVAGFRHRGSAEIRTELAGPLAVGTVTRILGLHDTDADQVRGWYTAIVAAVSSVSAGEPAGGEGTAAARQLTDHVLAAIGRPAAQGLLASAAAAPFQLAGPEIAANAAVLMFGGIETVEGMISNAVRQLFGDGAGAAALIRPDHELADAVEESLRLEPAAARVDRYATGATMLGGIPIPAGDLVIASISAANRDPAVFADPDRFDPSRPNNRLQLGFARGPHVCPAAGLARRQAVIALQALAELPGLRLDRECSTPPRGLVFRKPEAVLLRWDPSSGPGRTALEPPSRRADGGAEPEPPEG
jgi:cytochrome P450